LFSFLIEYVKSWALKQSKWWTFSMSVLFCMFHSTFPSAHQHLWLSMWNPHFCFLINRSAASNKLIPAKTYHVHLFILPFVSRQLCERWHIFNEKKNRNDSWWFWSWQLSLLLSTLIKLISLRITLTCFMVFKHKVADRNIQFGGQSYSAN
jgi:hypothetical protein